MSDSVTPWTSECQASLSITNSQSLLKLMSVESVMPSNHLILSSPSPPTSNLSQHQDLFQRVSSLNQGPNYWSFTFSISPSNKYSGLFSFLMNGLFTMVSVPLSHFGIHVSFILWNYLPYLASKIPMEKTNERKNIEDLSFLV